MSFFKRSIILISLMLLANITNQLQASTAVLTERPESALGMVRQYQTYLQSSPEATKFEIAHNAIFFMASGMTEESDIPFKEYGLASHTERGWLNDELSSYLELLKTAAPIYAQGVDSGEHEDIEYEDIIKDIGEQWRPHVTAVERIVDLFSRKTADDALTKLQTLLITGPTLDAFEAFIRMETAKSSVLLPPTPRTQRRQAVRGRMNGAQTKNITKFKPLADPLEKENKRKPKIHIESCNIEIRAQLPATVVALINSELLKKSGLPEVQDLYVYLGDVLGVPIKSGLAEAVSTNVTSWLGADLKRHKPQFKITMAYNQGSTTNGVHSLSEYLCLEVTEVMNQSGTRFFQQIQKPTRIRYGISFQLKLPIQIKQRPNLLKGSSKEIEAVNAAIKQLAAHRLLFTLESIFTQSKV